MRLFTAINFSDAVKKELIYVQNQLRKCADCGNFTREENLHITLVFLGEVSPERVTDIKGAIDSVRFQPFNMELSETGHFSRDGGDIWWIGARKNETLEHAQSQLAKELSNKGFVIENRKFVPHLTLGREVKLKTAFDIKDLCIKAEVDRISLMKSERVGGVLVYTEI